MADREPHGHLVTDSVSDQSSAVLASPCTPYIYSLFLEFVQLYPRYRVREGNHQIRRSGQTGHPPMVVIGRLLPNAIACMPACAACFPANACHKHERHEQISGPSGGIRNEIAPLVRGLRRRTDATSWRMSASLAPARSASRSDSSASPKRHTLSAPSAVSRSRLQPAQNGCVIDAMKDTEPSAPGNLPTTHVGGFAPNDAIQYRHVCAQQQHSVRWMLTSTTLPHH